MVSFSSLVVSFESSFTRVDNLLWRFAGFLCKNFSDHDRVSISPVNYAPIHVFIGDPKLVTSAPDGRHRPAMRQSDVLATLQPSQQCTGLYSCLKRKWRSLDLAFQPNEWFVVSVHLPHYMPHSTYVKYDMSNSLRFGQFSIATTALWQGRFAIAFLSFAAWSRVIESGHLQLRLRERRESLPLVAPMRDQDLLPPNRFMFWCAAPFLLATLVILPLCARPPERTGWIMMGIVEVLALCVLLGLFNPARFWWCWRAVGAIVFGGYLAYLISMTLSGQWFGDARRSSASAFNAVLGLIVFGYPGFMYAVFGRFTWRPEPEFEERSEIDEWIPNDMANHDDLCFACWSGDVPLVARLLSTTNNVDVRDEDGRTPLINAALDQEGNGAAIIRELLGHNPDLNAQDHAGWSALHFAAQENALEVATSLLESGAFVDPADAHGNTPLMKAVFTSRGDGHMIQLLRGRNADPYVRNNDGQTPVELARLINNSDVAQFFADLPEQDDTSSGG